MLRTLPGHTLSRSRNGAMVRAAAMRNLLPGGLFVARTARYATTSNISSDQFAARRGHRGVRPGQVGRRSLQLFALRPVSSIGRPSGAFWCS